MMMQDRKALQGVTSHFSGQNFAKASEIKFRDVDGEVVLRGQLLGDRPQGSSARMS